MSQHPLRELQDHSSYYREHAAARLEGCIKAPIIGCTKALNIEALLHRSNNGDLVNRLCPLYGVVPICGATGGEVHRIGVRLPMVERVLAARNSPPLPIGMCGVVHRQQAGPKRALPEGAPSWLWVAPGQRRPFVVPGISDDDVGRSTGVDLVLVHWMTPLVAVEMPIEHKVDAVLVKQLFKVRLCSKCLAHVVLVAAVPRRVELDHKPWRE
eukprot:CAMPEP_0115552078 /NCGR_PEP_ID=MMETSP0271-20121206/96053_1 /TAXON_ID=71861 /ORGANISM="Scrippsiella trochoidea, Strain CCMP3099" /LENGTH=211 /DNA_ID=CAMNT_0002985683 /DNA_START=87 /DNA_END=723 /DNA_ORIENTATION=-